MRFFNIAGPCRPEVNYMLPAERRFGDVPGLIEKQAYFVLHAPRQTGKTTTLMALAEHLTRAGKYAALHVSCEAASVFPDDVGEVGRGVWAAVEEAARQGLPEGLRPPATTETATAIHLSTQLTRWAESCPRPVVLLLDEVDSLSGDGLISILRQLRANYPSRPGHFPWSVVLCGMRDVGDYKAASGGGPVRLGTASPFNIKEESLRLGNFTEAEVGELYAQHTADTGQAFSPGAVARAFELTQGQPWLVNALARQIVEKMRVPLAETITTDHVDEAKERLILSRATHLDSLLARLREPAVQRVIEPILAGETTEEGVGTEATQYVVDLGLITPTRPPRIANPIYREVIVRTLADAAETNVTDDPRAFIAPDGRLDFPKLLRGFVDFWVEHGDALVTLMPYPEVAPQLVLLAYVHRIVNGGGYVDREVGIARKRIDVLVRWPFRDASGKRQWQKEALEVKVWRDRERRGDPLSRGLAQLDEYLAKLGLSEGTLAIFDARSAALPIEQRTRFEDAVTPSGRKVTVLRA